MAKRRSKRFIQLKEIDMDAERSKNNVAKRLYTYEVVMGYDFSKAFYYAIRDEMRYIANYIPFGWPKSILSELRAFYHEYK